MPFFSRSLFVDTSFQRQGIGSRLMRILIEEAARENNLKFATAAGARRPLQLDLQEGDPRQGSPLV
jgi:GNAT superfamily N-acetyltransferase